MLDPDGIFNFWLQPALVLASWRYQQSTITVDENALTFEAGTSMKWEDHGLLGDAV